MRMKIVATAGALVLAGGAVSIGFAAAPTAMGDGQTELGEPVSSFEGVARLVPAVGERATGMVSFRKLGGVLKIQAEIENAAPERLGLYVHENGDCGQFSPTGGRHGGPNGKASRGGELGDVVVDQSGMGRVDLELRDADHGGIRDARALRGRAVVLHADSGGLRVVACGVIEEEGGAERVAH